MVRLRAQRDDVKARRAATLLDGNGPMIQAANVQRRVRVDIFIAHGTSPLTHLFLYRYERQLALAQPPGAVRFNRHSVAGADGVAHEALFAGGFQNKHVAFFQ